jgi:hypothetical protein
MRGIMTQACWKGTHNSGILEGRSQSHGLPRTRMSMSTLKISLGLYTYLQSPKMYICKLKALFQVTRATVRQTIHSHTIHSTPTSTWGGGVFIDNSEH